MFQEQIASITASDLRGHIEEYLEDVDALYAGSDKMNLRVPEVSAISLVGGVMQARIDSLPLVAVDCLDKTVVPSNESLYLYQYEGAIVGLIEASSDDISDRRVKRYAAATEKFVREHQYLHENPQTNTKPFTFREFLYMATRFSGSMEVTSEDGPSRWIAAYIIEVLWVISEDGERQH
jgi:hypothetical protein